MSVVPGSAASARTTCGTESASPPVSSCRNGRRISGAASMIWFKRDAVNQAVVTPWLAMVRPSSGCSGALQTFAIQFHSSFSNHIPCPTLRPLEIRSTDEMKFTLALYG